jgi:hypothetical protein
VQLLRIALLSLLPLCSSLRAELEFVGVLADRGETRVVFRDQAAGFNSGWVGIGATVQGFTVVEYQAAREVLVLRQGEQLHEVALARSKIQGRKPDLTGEIRIGVATAAGIPVDLLLGVPRVVTLPDGRRLTLEARQEPDGKIAYHAAIDTPTGKVIVDGKEIPVIGKRQVNVTVPAGQTAVLQVAADVTVSLKL